jgi:hypothetical protein
MIDAAVRDTHPRQIFVISERLIQGYRFNLRRCAISRARVSMQQDLLEQSSNGTEKINTVPESAKVRFLCDRRHLKATSLKAAKINRFPHQPKPKKKADRIEAAGLRSRRGPKPRAW